MMSKKEYLMAAEIVQLYRKLDKPLKDEICGDIVMSAFAIFFSRDNPKFSLTRFFAACKGDSGASGDVCKVEPACCKAEKCGSCKCNCNGISAVLKAQKGVKKV